MNLKTAIDAFLDHRRGRSLARGTMDQYRYQLIERWMLWRRTQELSEDIESITVEEFSRYFHYLAEEHLNRHTGKNGLSANTIASAWRVIRAFWRYANRRKWLSDEQSTYFSRDDDLIPRPRIPERHRPQLPDDDLEKLLVSCVQYSRDVEIKARDRAMLLVLAESGCRISELASMLDENLDLDDMSCRIVGKGGREEWIFWSDRANRALQAYLQLRIGRFGGPQPVWRKYNKNVGMQVRAIRKMVRDIAEHAGVTLPFGAPVHSLRHRFAHKALDAGLDISQVQQLLRHRQISTTTIYLREHKARLRKIRDKMDDSR